MFNIIDYEKIANDKNCIFVDVRSESEFKKSTIKGAINIPVLLDEERAEVGTLYVRKSVEEARSKGIECISKRLPEIFNKIKRTGTFSIMEEYLDLMKTESIHGYQHDATIIDVGKPESIAVAEKYFK